MRPVIWSVQARFDLDAQLAYVTADSPQAAVRLRDRVFEVTDRLGVFATGRRGRMYRTYEQVVPRLPYIIVYRIGNATGAEAVEIVRIIHTSRDWSPGSWPE